jgi:hypothetical protein
VFRPGSYIAIIVLISTSVLFLHVHLLSSHDLSGCITVRPDYSYSGSDSRSNSCCRNSGRLLPGVYRQLQRHCSESLEPMVPVDRAARAVETRGNWCPVCTDSSTDSAANPRANGSGWSRWLGSGSWNRPHLRKHTRRSKSTISLETPLEERHPNDFRSSWDVFKDTY